MEHREIAETLLRAATELLGYQVALGNENRKRSKDACGLILDAHMSVTGAIGSIVARNTSVRSRIIGDSQKQIVLVASFVQGINIVECSISEGYYIQAAALLRQELETVAALEELKAECRQDRKTPNVKHVPWALSILYGDLSKAAHAADHTVLQDVLAPDADVLPKDTIGVAMTPQFKRDLAWRMMGFHVSLLILLAVHIHEHYELVTGTGMNEIEASAIKTAQEMLLQEGWFKPRSNVALEDL